MRSASYVLALATLLNFVNYIDRFILAAVLPRIKSELVLNDFQLGMLANRIPASSYFITLAAVSGGSGDRAIAAAPDRQRRVAALEPGHCGCRAGARHRTAPGRGASPASASARRHARDASRRRCWPIPFPAGAARQGVSAIFHVAIPVGAAVGFLLGGAARAGVWRGAWRLSAVGLPGLALA